MVIQGRITNVTGVRNSLLQAQMNAVGAEGAIAADCSQSLDELLVAL